jgi:hypothetical protein
LGLNCTPAGPSLAGVPLLRRTPRGFVPRPASEVALLLKAAYGEDPTGLPLRLGAIAQALNRQDFALAAIAAVQTRTPELSREAAARLADAERELTKYNPDEPRDWHGRWTRDGSAGPSLAAPGIESEESAAPHFRDQPQRVAENADATATDATALADNDDEPISLEQTFERKYDDLGPVDFAMEVIQFGDWLGRQGRNLAPGDKERALVEYSFLQDRLSFWLAYEYKPPVAQANLLSAALTLYQGAVNGGIANVGNLPQSMLATAGTAALLTDARQRIRPSVKPSVQEAPSAAVPKEIEGIGGIVNNSEAKIVWRKRYQRAGSQV